MTIALLATGDEIVHGDTLNTNSYAIAHALSSEGLPLGYHLSCSDKETDIVHSLEFLSTKHNIIILIGGLGPTTDDLTRFALAKFTQDPLVIHQEALTHIEDRLLAAKVPMNDGNKQQALFPAKAKILPNPNGSAVGCSYQWQDKTFFLLPGPPRECLPMFNDYVFPELQKTYHSNKQIMKWFIFGLAESEIAHVLENALADIDCHTGYRLDTPYIEFKVRCKPEVADKVKAIIDPIIEPHCITINNKKASASLYELIRSKQLSMTIIDEATGGVLEGLINKPETHNLVRFNNLRKSKFYFHISGLDEYWSLKPATGSSQLVIHFSNQAQEGKETHAIPYRSPLVVNYAAEWLSFRLLHLINQLHQ